MIRWLVNGVISGISMIDRGDQTHFVGKRRVLAF